MNDSVVLTEAVIKKTDINLFGRHAYLGGRPGIHRNIIFGHKVNLRSWILFTIQMAECYECPGLTFGSIRKLS